MTRLIAFSMVLVAIVLVACGDQPAKKPVTVNVDRSAVPTTPPDPASGLPTGDGVKDQPVIPAPVIPTADSAAKTDATPAADPLARGAKIYLKAKCTLCHKSADAPVPGLGPIIVNIGSKMSDDDIRIWLLDPAKKKPGTTMPAFKGTEEEIKDLIAYTKSLK